jgi:hypothetical protein
MLLHPACVHATFSDERCGGDLPARGVTLFHLQRAIWLGCARKYAALLNGTGQAPMFVTA